MRRRSLRELVTTSRQRPRGRNAPQSSPARSHTAPPETASMRSLRQLEEFVFSSNDTGAAITAVTRTISLAKAAALKASSAVAVGNDDLACELLADVEDLLAEAEMQAQTIEPVTTQRSIELNGAMLQLFRATKSTASPPPIRRQNASRRTSTEPTFSLTLPHHIDTASEPSTPASTPSTPIPARD